MRVCWAISAHVRVSVEMTGSRGPKRMGRTAWFQPIASPRRAIVGINADRSLVDQQPGPSWRSGSEGHIEGHIH